MTIMKKIRSIEHARRFLNAACAGAAEAVRIPIADRRGRNQTITLTELYSHDRSEQFPLWRNWQAHIFPICFYHPLGSDACRSDIEAYLTSGCTGITPDILGDGGCGGSGNPDVNELRRG